MTTPVRIDMGRIYLLVAMVGGIVPWWALCGFLQQAEPTPARFLAAMFVNPVAAAVSLDLLISALLFLLWVYVEGLRLGMARLWWYLPATFLVGLSFGLPLFLYFRNRHLNRVQQEG
jgi:hypothetical protein